MRRTPRRRLMAASVALAVASWLLVPRAGFAARVTAVTVTIHTHQIIVKKIIGCGVEFDPFEHYPVSQPIWRQIIRRVSFMHPAFVRTMVQRGMYRVRADGHARFVWQKPIDPGAYRRFNRLLRILRWAQKTHVQVMLGQWGPAALIARASRADLDHWAAHTAAIIYYLRVKQHLSCIRNYNFINEPVNLPASLVCQASTLLHRALAARGLARAVAITGPDTFGDPGRNIHWSFPLLLPTLEHAAAATGCYEVHWYAQDWEVKSHWIEQTLIRQRRLIVHLDPSARRKTLIMSETGLIDGKCNGDQQPRVKTFAYGVLMADYAAQVFGAGWDGISAWDLDDAMHIVGGQRVTTPPGKLTLKIWGFWNSQAAAMGKPADFDIRPRFYTWALLSRLFPIGTRIVKSNDPKRLPHFITLAGTRIVHGRWRISIMLVNTARTARHVSIRIRSKNAPATFTEYRYFRHDRPTDSYGFPIPAKRLKGIIAANGFNLYMPGQGVIFLTN